MKTLFNFRLGNPAWSLSLGEYLFLVLAVCGGWLAGGATSRQSVAARSSPTYQIAGGTNATAGNPVADHGLVTE